MEIIVKQTDTHSKFSIDGLRKKNFLPSKDFLCWSCSSDHGEKSPAGISLIRFHSFRLLPVWYIVIFLFCLFNRNTRSYTRRSVPTSLSSLPDFYFFVNTSFTMFYCKFKLKSPGGISHQASVHSNPTFTRLEGSLQSTSPWEK